MFQSAAHEHIGPRARAHEAEIAAIRQVVAAVEHVWVMAKENGRWLLTAGQNTGAPDDELEEDTTGGPVFAPAG
ncbi:hypothetical protein [Marinactinospora rubrisoli]|uniref:Uncharacterized protein n=1 Tax=Marinactinospora rubrisoli TaxID=2715399 RepID=A0ABW2KFN5_9ACTN